nr:hypothetical protein [uncultured Bacillus sp.]
MKRLAGLILMITILYSIYYDISYGTLTAISSMSTSSSETAPKTAPQSKPELPYFKKKVANGDTVLSILEEHLNGPIPVPIADVVTDFKKLNNGLAPQDIQPGKTYKFPLYSKTSE